MVARRQLDRVVPERARERAPEPAEARPVAPVPAQLLALQRGVGNHAVTRMLQRKVDDLPVNPTVDPKLADKIQAYNRTPRIAELEGAAAERQRKLDQDALGGLADMAYAIEGKDEAANSYLTDLRQQIDAQSMGLIQAQPSKPAVQLPPPKAQVRPEETLEVEDFPHEELAAPPQKNASMFTPETMRVKIGGKPYRLWAGQNYLNPTGSTRYQKSAADIKSGPVKVLVSGDQAMVGDSHHRFVWKAFHGLAMTATVKPVFGLPADKTAWNVLTYKLDPKNEYEFSPTDPANADLRLAAASPLPAWQGFADWPLDLLTEHIGKARKNSDISVYAEELPPLRDHLRTARVWSFRAFVQEKVQQATNQAQAKALAKIMLGSFQWGYEPNVILGRTPSQGYWSKEHHVIVLDPSKNPSANALLDTLAYESGNALRREDYLRNAHLTAQIEFEVTDAYVAMLMEATRSGGINSLVVALEIPDQFLKTLADPAKSLAEKKLRKPDGSDAMPDEATLAPQYQRTALAFYLQQEWSPAERLRYFATSSHAEGMKATAATYQSHEGGAAFADQAIARKSPSCLRPLVLAMLDVYPGAGQRDFDRLQPRQFGEFLTTGRVDRWDVALAGQPAVRQDLMLRVIEDMAKVYPNRSAWERRLKDLSDTDFGEFLLYGRVRSWEDRELMART